MSDFVPTEHPHRRQNLLTGEWILVSPHRTKRPWQGQVEPPDVSRRPSYDPDCYLCPGNARAGGKTNPPYTQTYVFENDFAALLPASPQGDFSEGPFFQIQGEVGLCRVICFSSRHDLTLPEMSIAEIHSVVQTWRTQIAELSARPDIGYVQLFENKGAVMGSSNPHPHGQLWATASIPVEPAKEDRRQADYFQATGSPLLLDYLAAELAREERIVVQNEHWVALVPFWALWPFETLLLPRRHVTQMPELLPAEEQTLAQLLKELLTRYDNLFSTSFPYSMGWHGGPCTKQNSAQNKKAGDNRHWQLHAHFYPPLLRSATIKKFMVGYEMLAMPQRDITPEQAAQRLREVDPVHYRLRSLDTDP